MQRQFIAPLAAYLRDLGHEVWQVNGASRSIRRTISPWDVLAIARLWWTLRHLKIEVLHVQTAKAGAVGRIAAWLAGTPRIVYTMHDVPFYDGLSPWRQRLYVWIERVLAKLCQAITVDSPAVKNRALVAQVAPAHKIHVISVGVDTSHFDPARYMRLLDLPMLCVGTVARLVPEKGIDRFLELTWAISQHLPIHVLIVGDGPERMRLEAQAHELHEFVGDQVDVRPLLASMDLFVLPTQREGLSVAVMEAMSMALPVVVSDLPAFDGLVIHERTGWRVPPMQWMTSLLWLLASSGLRSTLGRAARAHVQKYYEQSASCRAYAQVLTT